MQCPECKKLSLECRLAATNHLNLVRLHDADAPEQLRTEPDIWDFILDAAIKARDDAHRAFEDHRAKHKPMLGWVAWIVMLVAVEIDSSDFTAELWETLKLAFES